jgi:hypothetical protein
MVPADAEVVRVFIEFSVVAFVDYVSRLAARSRESDCELVTTLY